MDIEELKDKIRAYYPEDHIVFYSIDVSTRRTYVQFSRGAIIAMGEMLNNGKLLKIYELKGAHEL